MFPCNSVIEPELVQRHLTTIHDHAVILCPKAAKAAIDELPEGEEKQTFMKVLTLVKALKKHYADEE